MDETPTSYPGRNSNSQLAQFPPKICSVLLVLPVLVYYYYHVPRYLGTRVTGCPRLSTVPCGDRVPG
eukprot:1515080-Rhodomonas_salina.1